jgi:predicted transcriptional regulator
MSNVSDRGWSQRRIASELGINRETVGRYLRLAKPAISTTSVEEGEAPKPAIPITGKQAREDESKPAISIAGITTGRRSYCEPLAEAIAAKVEVGLSARHIYQDLVEQNGFSDSYL